MVHVPSPEDCRTLEVEVDGREGNWKSPIDNEKTGDKATSRSRLDSGWRGSHVTQNYDREFTWAAQKYKA